MYTMRHHNPNEVAAKILEKNSILCIENRYYKYASGVYKLVELNEIGKLIKDELGMDFNRLNRDEVKSSITAEATISMHELETPENFINVKNGYLNLNDLKLEPHTDDFEFLSQLETEYDPSATCSMWLDFLNQTFADDPQKIWVIQEFFGYCLTPLTIYEKALILVGNGANGKSVILNVLKGFVGNDNCCHVAFEQFKDNFYLAHFFQKMVNISTETNAKTQIYEARFKQLVTGESITASVKYGHPFSFNNTAKLAFSFNEMPHVDDKTYAFYRRLLPVYCNIEIPEDKQDKELTGKLLKERSGILNWAIEGLNRLRKNNGFTMPKSVRDAIEDYRADNNPVLGFVDEACVVRPDLTIAKGTLYSAYKKYCEDHGYMATSDKKFGKQLKLATKNQAKDLRTGSERLWGGIDLGARD